MIPIATAPIPIVQRGPNVSEIHPMSGAPAGVPPMKIAMYNAMTRPRISGATRVWTMAFAVVSAVSAENPTGTRARANVQYVGAVAATVVDRSYFGHDQLVELELSDGHRVRSRLPGTTRWSPGDAVLVWLSEPVAVLAAAAAPEG